ncbi:MAG: NAD(P)H-hydrate dehydratase [Clostridiales bacterium]|nr:NAD(P)H-hydrate dehydratase [Clostridiales bacterium]
MLVLDSEQTRLVEKRAVDCGLSYLRLMENAGSACAKIMVKSLSLDRGNTVAILCGKGKNGGDGFVIARKLCEAGCKVTVILVGHPTVPDEVSEEMLDRITNLPISILRYSADRDEALSVIASSQTIVDAIFGIGFHGKLSGDVLEAIAAANESRAYKVAVDIPSGLECDYGDEAFCFEASMTITMSTLKPVHVLYPARVLCGEIKVAEIGIPESCYEGVRDEGFYILHYSEIRSRLPKRRHVSHKGTYGKLLCVCGSRMYQGAAAMAAKAAVNSGAGVVSMAIPDCIYIPIASKMWETPIISLPSNEQGMLSELAVDELLEYAQKSTTLLIGCGLGVSSDTKKLVKELLLSAECPIVLDADGLTCISDCLEILKQVKAPVIVTPHPGEMARLTGRTVGEVNENRVSIAKEFAAKYGVAVVLKGSNTVVAYPGSLPYVNRTGNAGLATGGSGDVLSGMIASFVAQGMSIEDAAVCGVYLHGRAGNKVSERTSMMGTTPTECIKEIPNILI